MSECSNPYLVLAYYLFTELKDPHHEVLTHIKFFKERDVTARIYLSEQGINGQMCASKSDANAYMEWMQQRPEFPGIWFKIQPHHEHVFPRLTIKYRKQLVALDAPANLTKRGQHVSPETWKKMLEKKEEYVLLDVRNEYEWKLGRFENAELPPCGTFREFNAYSEKLKEEKNPKKTSIMMYCTGGIRCELYSSILLEKGFENVYQLDGGIINYGAKEGSKHWLGKLFVFDDRLSVPISEKEDAPAIGQCHHCKKTIEAYFNCANMDCNTLFLCCPDCLHQFQGCCQESCKSAPRVRPYQHQNPHKPFRKWYHYTDQQKKTTHQSTQKAKKRPSIKQEDEKKIDESNSFLDKT